MRNFIAAIIVLFTATTMAMSQNRDMSPLEVRNERRIEQLELQCVVIKVTNTATDASIDKVLRCENRESICYLDNNSISCMPKQVSVREY